jgi:hypothetical protein
MSAWCLAGTLTSLLAARWRTSMLSSLQILPLPPRRPPSAWPLPLPHHRVPLAAPRQFLRPPLQGRAPMLRPRDHLTALHPVWWHMHGKNVGVVPLSPHPRPALLQWLTCSLCYCGHGNEPERQKLSLSTNAGRQVWTWSVDLSYFVACDDARARNPCIFICYCHIILN